MKTLLMIILVLQTFLVVGCPDAYADETWMREGLAQQIEKFQRTTFMPHPASKGLIAANCESDLSWWGSVRVFHHEGDQIDWMATFPKDYTQNCGHYVLSCKWRHLEKLSRWVLEVFDSTHMGNGSLWLFELEGHDFRLLLHTNARGRFLEPPPASVIANGQTRLIEEHLISDYHTPDGASASAESVFLTGTLAILDQEDKEVSRKPYAETWTWDVSKRVFAQPQP